MRFLDYFYRGRRKSASVAKDRLQIIVARERNRAGTRDYLPLLHQELLQVIAKYESIDLERVSVNLDRRGDCEVLELNVVLPEGGPAQDARPARRSTSGLLNLGAPS
ncbi:MAG: cell division topological specificity factor MinE [Proteobacteria bacterium]|nr:cell division topological specificity factor MinE [Pseudomonadota bacterium]